MKKVFVLFLCLALAVSLMACGKEEAAGKAKEETEKAAEDVAEIGKDEAEDAAEEIKAEGEAVAEEADGEAEEGAKEADESAAGLANPVHEATVDSILTDLGIDMSACDAYEAAYSTIDGEPTVAQAQFTADGLSYTYRIAAAAEATDISGLFYKWDEETTATVADREASVVITKDGVGCISWFDVVPGIMYTLSMDKGATAELLTDMANQLFVPLQGEA